MRQQTPKQIQRGRKILFLLRIHAWFTIIALFVYAFLGFLWGPTFRVADMHEKWSVFADDEITVSANVLPPPAVPIVSGISECLSDEIQVHLDWADDISSDSFDVYRDGSLLVSGLLVSHYDDESAFADTNHSYVVKAYGQMAPGVASSVSTSVLTQSDCLNSLRPKIETQTIAGKNVVSISQISLTDRSPRITGTSNMPHATISLSLVGANSTYATFLTNATGYWEWTPTSSLAFDTYTFTVTVTHPVNLSEKATESKEIVIEENKKSSDSDDDTKEDAKRSVVRPLSLTPELSPDKLPQSDEEPSSTTQPSFFPLIARDMPVLVTLDILNPRDEVFQWRSLEVSMRIDALCSTCNGENAEVVYSIVNEAGEEMSSFSRQVDIRAGDIFREAIPIAQTWPAGSYFLKTKIHIDSMSIEYKLSFRVNELPAIDLGAGMLITWNDIFRTLGWIIAAAALAVLFFSLLFMWEYWLYDHLSGYITEIALGRNGFFGRRKEVGQR